MRKKLGLALGSGGARGAAHIGFLQALEENGIAPSYIAGSSMGALVGACYASGMGLESMKEILFSLKTKDILDIEIIPLTKLSLFKSNKLREQITKYLGNKTFEDLNIPFECVAVNLLNGEAVRLGKGRDLAESVIASCSIPTIFRPVETKDGMLLIDGGIADRVPAGIVKDMGANKVVAVDVLGKYRPAESVKNILGVMLRMIDIMDYHSSERKKRDEEGMIDLWVEIEMGDISQYNIKNVQTACEAGYKAGLEKIKQIEKLL